MGVDDYLNFATVAIQTALLVSAPVLLLGLAAGLFVSIFQAATQINDGALAFIPKIAAALLGIILFGNFMLNRIAAFTIWVYGYIGTLKP